MTGLRFQDPLWLLLLIPLAALGVWAARQQRRAAVLYSDVTLVAALPRTFALRVKRWLPWLRLAGLGLLVAALARPQWGREEFRIRGEGIAMQVCIDRSGSMQALDFEIEGKRANRLEVVKRVFREFVEGNGKLPGRPDDLIGLIAFGGYAEAKCPLTLDHGVLLQVLDTVQIAQPILDSQRRVINQRLLEEEIKTAIGDAVALAIDRIKDAQAKSKVIILLSDGEQTAGWVEPEEAAQAAKALGIKIYTIGVGTTGVVPMPSEDFFGNPILVGQRVRLDEQTLKRMAETTGGRYFNAQDTQALQDVYAEIDRLEKTAAERRQYSQYREIYQYAMFPGLAMILLELLLISTRFRSLP